jgi:proteasome lid subunit RPN8/RPN11
VLLSKAEWIAIATQALVEYPAECCGVILVRGDERLWLRCHNEQDALHARDPQAYPRNSRTAFHVHALDRLLMGALEMRGFAVAVIYHSHIDVGAYFSETDRRNALGGQDPKFVDPMYPDAIQIVMSVVAAEHGTRRKARLDDIKGFKWDAVKREFGAIDLDVEIGALAEDK